MIACINILPEAESVEAAFVGGDSEVSCFHVFETIWIRLAKFLSVKILPVGFPMIMPRIARFFEV